MKLKWRVAPVPVGRYRSFEQRDWPSATYHGTDNPAASITCADQYVPQDVRDGNHRPLTVLVARWLSPEERGTRSAFSWHRVTIECATLAEAKGLAESILTDRPNFWPEGVK